MAFHACKILVSASLALVLASGVSAADPMPPGSFQDPMEVEEGPPLHSVNLTEESPPIRNLGNALEKIRVPERSSQEFALLYQRHKDEILQILSDRPAMILQVIEIFIEALPGLKAIDSSQGRLYLDKKLFQKGESFLAAFEQCCSYELASDLRRTRRFVLDRLEELPNDQVVIDLN